MIRGGNEQPVHVLVFQHTAEIRLLLRRVTLDFLRRDRCRTERTAVHINDVVKLHTGQLGELLHKFDAAPALARRSGTKRGTDELTSGDVLSIHKAALHSSGLLLE